MKMASQEQEGFVFVGSVADETDEDVESQDWKSRWVSNTGCALVVGSSIGANAYTPLVEFDLMYIHWFLRTKPLDLADRCATIAF